MPSLSALSKTAWERPQTAPRVSKGHRGASKRASRGHPKVAQSMCSCVPLSGGASGALFVPSCASLRVPLGPLWELLGLPVWGSFGPLLEPPCAYGRPPLPMEPRRGALQRPFGPSRAVIDHCPPGRTRNIANGRGRGRADGVVQVLPRRSVRVGPCLRAWHGMPTHAQASPGRCRGMPRHMPRHLLRPATSSYVQLRPRCMHRGMPRHA